jgi:hypothetical protein
MNNYKSYFKDLLFEAESIKQKLQEQIPDEELEMGIEDELEHTNDRTVARQIAITHLQKDNRYYSKMRKCGLMKEVNDICDGGVLPCEADIPDGDGSSFQSISLVNLVPQQNSDSTQRPPQEAARDAAKNDPSKVPGKNVVKVSKTPLQANATNLGLGKTPENSEVQSDSNIDFDANQKLNFKARAGIVEPSFKTVDYTLPRLSGSDKLSLFESKLSDDFVIESILSEIDSAVRYRQPNDTVETIFDTVSMFVENKFNTKLDESWSIRIKTMISDAFEKYPNVRQ